MTAVTVCAPLGGRVLAMADVPDPVFSEQMLGPGLAIDPPLAEQLDVFSPVDGTVRTVLPHAVAVQTDAGHGVLVHLGLNTVEMQGTGFLLAVSKGDVVEVGQHVISWSPRDVDSTGRSVVTAVVALQAEPEELRLLVVPGDEVAAGDPLYVWTRPTPAGRVQ
ncbi:MAG TPA: PTS glucose transporter subunit IIA [Actinotalea sp.]|nr:PTS glucose transporter subunit IIA [Actinotalea sp.]